MRRDKIRDQSRRSSLVEPHRLLNLLDAVDDGVAYYNAAGQLEYYNTAFLRIHNDIAEHIFLGNTFENIIRAGLKKNLWELEGLTETEFLRTHLTARSESGVETIVKFNDGRFIRRKEFFADDGGMIGTRSDISALKQTEEALATALEEVQQLNRNMSLFLASISHEIKNPLNGIIGISELLSLSELTTQQREQLSIISRSGQIVLSITKNILDFSKIDAGKIDLEPVKFSLRELLTDIIALHESKAKASGIKLAYRIDDNISDQFFGDIVRIKQVLMNLVGNAVKFTDKGGVRVDLKAGLISKKPALNFRVLDSGIGIPKEKLDIIFEEFSQADKNTTRIYGGTGLGLNISKKLVELMGGKLKVTSIPGKGSCFEFSLEMSHE